jgi:hypothetical protein
MKFPGARWLADYRARRALAPVLALLEGRRVAIVGNAANLLHHSHGALIDQHDLVVRMNLGFPVNPAAQGHRFDLWCFSHYRVLRQTPPGFVAPTSVWMSPKFRDQADRAIPHRFYPMSYWRALRRQLGARPSVGAMTIDLVSHAKPREVMIIGFDFNRSKTFYETRTLPSPHDFAAEERYVTDLIAHRSWRFVIT